MAKKAKISGASSEKKKVSKKIGKEISYVPLDNEKHDTSRTYSGPPMRAAKRFWKTILRETGKKLDVVMLRERGRYGKERGLHIFKLKDVVENTIPNEDKYPEFIRGRTYLTPIFEKKPKEHINTLEARAPYLKDASVKKQKKAERGEV